MNPSGSPILISVALNYPGSSRFRTLVDQKDYAGIVHLIEKKLAQGAQGFDLCLATHPQELSLLFSLGKLIAEVAPHPLLLLDSPDPQVLATLVEDFPYPFVLNSLGPSLCRHPSSPYKGGTPWEVESLIALLERARSRNLALVVQLNPYREGDLFPPFLLAALERTRFPLEHIYWDPLLYPRSCFTDSIEKFCERVECLKPYGGKILIALANILFTEPRDKRPLLYQQLCHIYSTLPAPLLLTPLPLPFSLSSPPGETPSPLLDRSPTEPTPKSPSF